MCPASPADVAPPLILASTSPYRRELLARFGLPFTVVAPGVNEDALVQESPPDLAQRLAREKALAVAARHPAAVVIGSDQVAALGERMLGKPGTRERAAEQLHAMSGRRVAFHTAVCVARQADGHVDVALATVQVRFRVLAPAEIERYLDLEQPYDCAGSAKAEALGIVLLDAIESDDPTALIGLPLIRTAAMLRAAGIDPLRPTA